MNKPGIMKFALAILMLIISSSCAFDSTTTPMDPGSVFTESARTAIAEITNVIATIHPSATQEVEQEQTRVYEAAQTIVVELTKSAIPSPNPVLGTPSPDGPTPTPIPTAVILSQENCNRAEYLADISPSNKSVFYPGEVLVKTWRLQNVGVCTWSPDYKLVMTSGEFLGNTVVPLPEYIRPGQTIDISANLIAPNRPGNYVSAWHLSNASDILFGFGPNGDNPLLFQVFVLEASQGYVYDFALNYCGAEWRTGEGMIPCSGFDDNEKGLVVLMDYPVLETGVGTGAALWMHPNNAANGWISGIYPAIEIRPGDRFKAQVGCLIDSPTCDVLLQVEAEIPGGSVDTLGQWREGYNGQLTSININLNRYAGKFVRFILTVTMQSGLPEDANGVWVAPRLGP